MREAGIGGRGAEAVAAGAIEPAIAGRRFSIYQSRCGCKMKWCADLYAALLISVAVHLLAIVAAARLASLQSGAIIAPAFAQGETAIMVSLVAPSPAASPDQAALEVAPASDAVVVMEDATPEPDDPPAEADPPKTMETRPTPERTLAFVSEPVVQDVPDPRVTEIRQPAAVSEPPRSHPARELAFVPVQRRFKTQGALASAVTAESRSPVVPTRSAAGDGAASGVETAVAYRTDVRPAYPMSARLRGEEGMVTVKVTINGAAQAESAEVETSSGFPTLDRAALAAARKATFVASGGAAVAGGRILLTFRFKLVDG